jgi:hypothetical protein
LALAFAGDFNGAKRLIEALMQSARGNTSAQVSTG